MTEVKADKLARELVRLLNEMARLHDELAMHMRNKIEAIRRADSDEIQSITAREMLLANRVAEREGLRRDLVRNVLVELGMDPRDARTVRMNELAQRFAEPRRSQILVAAAGLRAKLEAVDRVRALTALITDEMLKHMQAIITVMTAGGPSTGVYSRAGNRETAARSNVFEAVG